ncbi:multicopper oxidase domain-containing protein [Haloarcula nitratireducens]|uniref:Multicopper oxidase domain-containing protein n=1 Tax=Haloarcula nitratireducens TaxID=2487749 RepID=A0AAW4P7R2_9EURY|nr:multicopper oxidase domain-containing protein [Halomicroarcula nitratireducens]MBX0293911.1 multicopper oxidase domain-containing protein [Halomicroarcula nitratireducens]
MNNEAQLLGTTGNTTRRNFLKGGSSLAAAAAFPTGASSAGEDERTDHVPDEPDGGGKVRHFDVHAIDVDIVYNRYGLHQPVGVMYALKEDVDEIRELSGKVPCDQRVVFDDDDEAEESFCDDIPDGKKADGDTRLIQPLTLRAERGDIIEIEFHNDLDCRVSSMHQTSLPYEVKESDGMEVGFNPDTTVEPGESITYRWHAAELGQHFFLDGANQAFDSADEDPQKANLLSRGLFGTVSVFPQGTDWTDPLTGEEVQGRVQADIHLPDDVPDDAVEQGFPSGTSYREFLVHYHTPEGIQTADGGQLTYPNSDEEQTVHAINYRADPTGNRIPALENEESELKESFYNSWLHGDPGGGDNVYPMYVGDPVKAVAVGASVEENHVHHLHGHRWKEVPGDIESDTIDSQTVGLGATYTAPYVTGAGEPQAGLRDFTSVRPDMDFTDAFEVGAGGAHGSPGDYLFHCHLFPHYGEGMWGLMRALDKETDELQPLPNNDPPIPKESDIPGYPEFIPGEFNEDPPFPPYGAAGKEEFRDPEPDEERALTREGEILPGAPYTDPCEPDIEDFEPEYEGETREYTIVALPADIVYNDAGHHDPNGIVYVLEEHADLVKEGKMNPEPLVIRANVGDCVEITFRNEVTDENIAAIPADRTPDNSEGKPESVPIEEGGKSNHIHFVSYDVLGSDSLANGFNYRQDSQPGCEAYYRWYADEEGTIFFHDHITGIEDVMHGSFASLVVEPPNSEWLDPYNGEPIKSGTQAIIDPEEGEAYREFCVAYQDFAQLLNRDGELINKDAEHNENSGVMSLNYRNTPYYIRDDCDPAYVHSSYVHGDPSTPVFEAYEDDNVRFRLWQACYEEQHNFSIHGKQINPVGLDPQDTISQIIGTSEAFTFDIVKDDYGTDHDGFEELRKNPSGLPIRDYVYGSTIVDDRWDGMWGLYREFGGEVDHLYPVPGQGTPKKKIKEKDLKEMGHPAPWSDFDWSEKGQLARLLYDEDDDCEFPPDKDARQNDSIDGDPPDIAPRPGDPCPADARKRSFDVSAFNTEITYNEYDDHDPIGIVYALEENIEGIEDGCLPLTPLTLRTNVGDCIEVTLTNDVDFDEIEEIEEDLQDSQDGEGHAHPRMQTSRPWERSERISLHPQRLDYDVLASDGVTAGFNWDQTIGPGESITYRWFANGEVGTSVLFDHADLRSNRHHGAYGRILVEDEGVKYLDPHTAEPARQGIGDSTMLKVPDGPDRRNYSLAFADGQFILNEDDPDDCVVPPGPDIEDPDDPCNQLGDPEDHGYQAINYRNEPFTRRFDEDPDPPDVYDSDTHGDPATPVLRALLGDPVTFRVHKTADKADGLVFHLSDHMWKRFRGVENSATIGVDDRVTVGKADNIEPLYDAGGYTNSTGDFIYQETRERRKLEAGYWGIFRVRDKLRQFGKPVQPLPDQAHNIPLRKRPEWVVATGDIDGDGTKDLVVGVPNSVFGSKEAGAAYLFFGPVEKSEITDLSDADIRVVAEPNDGDPKVDIVVNDTGAADSIVDLIKDTVLTVKNCKDLDVTFDKHTAEHFESATVTIGDDEVDVELDDVSISEKGTVVATLADGTTLTVRGCQSFFDD